MKTPLIASLLTLPALALIVCCKPADVSPPDSHVTTAEE